MKHFKATIKDKFRLIMEEKLKYLRLLFIAWFILVIIMSIIKCC